MAAIACCNSMPVAESLTTRLSAQTVFHRRQPGLAAVALIRDMDVGDGRSGANGARARDGQGLQVLGGRARWHGRRKRVKVEPARSPPAAGSAGAASGPLRGGEGEGQHGAAHTATDDSHVDVNQIRLRHEKRAWTKT